MPSLSRLLGWTPPTNTDYVNVHVPDHHHSHQPHDFDDASTPVSHLPSNAYFNGPSPPCSVYSDHDKSPESSSKRGDPNWVARPRNEFILFRCDYVRRHTKEGTGKRTRRPPGQESEKTLSKLVAEAWRALTPEDRVYWREQANIERDEHAKKYPDYRYRPKKSATGRKRQGRSGMASAMMTKSAPAPALLDAVTVDSSGRSFAPVHITRSVDRQSLAPTPIRRDLRKAISTPYFAHHPEPVDFNNQPYGLLSYPTFMPIRKSLHYDYTSMSLAAPHPPSSFASSSFTTPDLSDTMSLRGSASSSSLANWNNNNNASTTSIPVSCPQPTPYAMAAPGGFSMSLIDPTLLPQSPQNKFSEHITGGMPMQPFQLDDFAGQVSVPPPAPYTSLNTTGLLTRKSSASDSVYLTDSAASSFIYPDSSANTSLLFEEYGQSQCSPISANPLTISPAEYFGSSGELSPDEMFTMDREDYFTGQQQQQQ